MEEALFTVTAAGLSAVFWAAFAVAVCGFIWGTRVTLRELKRDLTYAEDNIRSHEEYNRTRHNTGRDAIRAVEGRIKALETATKTPAVQKEV